MNPRSWLFVPGDSPQKMEKALGSGADALILDLEDSVAPSRKAQARGAVQAFLGSLGPTPSQLWVRINSLAAMMLEEDLKVAVVPGVAGLMLPKPDSARDAVALASELERFETAVGLEAGHIRILPVATETPLAVFNLNTYAGATSRLAALT
jgi:citrate lyase subunit beta / citryl-CoA lyase